MDKTPRTDRFRYNRWVARRTAAFAMVLLYGLLLWVILQDGPNTWLELLLVGITAVLSLIYVIISRHSVTRLTIGPDGISAPFGLLRIIRWDEVDQVEYVPAPLLFPDREKLHVRLKRDVRSLAKVPLPSFVEAGLIKRGLVIPLHVLRAPTENIRSSISRFATIVETDVQSEALTKSTEDTP